MNKELSKKLECMLKNICDDTDYVRGIMILLRKDKHKSKMIDFIRRSKTKPTPDEVSYYALILDKENGSADEYADWFCFAKITFPFMKRDNVFYFYF